MALVESPKSNWVSQCSLLFGIGEETLFPRLSPQLPKVADGVPVHIPALLAVFPGPRGIRTAGNRWKPGRLPASLPIPIFMGIGKLEITAIVPMLDPLNTKIAQKTRG